MEKNFILGWAVGRAVGNSVRSKFTTPRGTQTKAERILKGMVKVVCHLDSGNSEISLSFEIPNLSYKWGIPEFCLGVWVMGP